MDPSQGAMYALVIKLVGILFNPTAAQIVAPVLAIWFLLRFFNWIFAVGSGQRETDIYSEVENIYQGGEQRRHGISGGPLPRSPRRGGRRW